MREQQSLWCLFVMKPLNREFDKVNGLVCVVIDKCVWVGEWFSAHRSAGLGSISIAVGYHLCEVADNFAWYLIPHQ